MTYNEIVKALRSWLEEIRKSRQAYLEKVNEEHYSSMWYEYLLSDTIHEINRLQAENERLKNAYKQVAWERDIFAEDMKQEIKKDCSYLMLDIKTTKAEAYKEFAERVKDTFEHAYQFEYGYLISKDVINAKIDNLVKEMVGENND